MVELRRPWDKNLDQSTPWARKWKHWFGRGVLEYEADSRGDSLFVRCHEKFWYRGLFVAYRKALSTKNDKIAELSLSGVWFDRPYDKWYGIFRYNSFGVKIFTKREYAQTTGSLLLGISAFAFSQSHRSCGQLCSFRSTGCLWSFGC